MIKLKSLCFLFLSCLLLVPFCGAQNNDAMLEKNQYSYQHHIKGDDTLQYRMLLPKGFSENMTYPVVLFLHGAGERGNDNEKQLIHGSSLFLDKTVRDSFPAIVIAPQCPTSDYWSKVGVDRSTNPIGLNFKYDTGPTDAMALVMDLMDHLTSKSYVKNNQIYVMGLSMGGMGTFEIIYRKPELFAAAIPICGGGDPESVSNYAKSIPIWAFHGAKDNVVDPKLSLDMVAAILKAGGFPKFTLYDYANHNSWDPAFAELELLSWLFSNTK